MRYKYSDICRYSNGDVIPSATIYVYLAGGTTPATIYTSATETSHAHSVDSDSVGQYTFYVDAFEYGSFQTFKIEITKGGYPSQVIDNVLMEDVVLGTYDIDSEVIINASVDIPSGVTINNIGGGYLRINSSNIYLDGRGTINNCHILIGGDSEATYIENFSVKGIKIKHDSIGTDLDGIRLQHVHSGIINNVHFENCDHAIKGVNATAILQQQVRRIIVSNNRFINNNYNIYLDNDSPISVYKYGDFQVTNNIFEDTNKYHVYGIGVDGFLFSGNTCFFPSYTGHSQDKTNHIYLSESSFPIISNNNLFEAGTESILLNKCQYINISDNMIAWPGQRAESAAIRLTNGDISGSEFNLANITGNNITFSSGHAISIEDNCGFIHISGNYGRAIGNNTYYYGSDGAGNPALSGTAYAVQAGALTGMIQVSSNYLSKQNNLLGSYCFDDTNFVDVVTNPYVTKKSNVLSYSTPGASAEIDVTGMDEIIFSPASALTVANFTRTDTNTNDQITCLFLNNNTTILNSSDIKTLDDADFNPRTNESVIFTYMNSAWYETSKNKHAERILSYTTPGTGVSISISGYDTVGFAPAAGLTVADFTFAREAVSLESRSVKLFFFNGNTTLTHGASTIILNGASDVTPSANGTITLTYYNGVWYEMARNF